MEPEAAPIRRRLVGKQPLPQAYGGATVTVKAALTDEEKLLLQMPGGISPAEVAQRIAQASGLEPEAISLMLDGSPLAGPLPYGSVEVLMLKRTGPTQEFKLGGDGIDFKINIETSEPALAAETSDTSATASESQ